MNNGMKNIIIFAAGAGLGALATYIYMKAKYEEIINEEMDIILDRVSNELKNNCHDPEEIEEEEITKRVTSKIIEFNKYQTPTEMVSSLGIRKRRMEEEELAASEHPRDDDNYHEELFIPRGEPKTPYIITEDQFYNEYEHYDKTTIYFFEEDNVLVDEREELIDDPESIIGDVPAYLFAENEHNMVDYDDDPDVIHIRNDKLATDFEVIRRDESYRNPLWNEEEREDE